MENPLVVTDASDRAPELIQEAGELAEAAGTPLTVLTVVTREEFENDAEVMSSLVETGASRHFSNPKRYAQTIAEKADAELLRHYDIETASIGRGVDDEAERGDVILDVAEEQDADYIFLMARKRSPTGKVIFGDTAQQVILNFDGFVVTLLD